MKKTLTPLHWWNHPEKTSMWGTDKTKESPIIDPKTNEPVRKNKRGAVNSSDKLQVTSENKRDVNKLVETAPASALDWLKKKIPGFGRKK